MRAFAWGRVRGLGIAGAVALEIGAAGCQISGPILSVSLASQTAVATFPNACELDVDFWGVPIGRAATATVEIRNNGAAPVTFLASTAEAEADFVVAIEALQQPLQPGSVAKVPITFEPSELGEASSTFSVSSSVLATACASSGSTFTVKLAGSGIALSLVTTPETLDFGNTLIGTAVTETMTLKNQSKTAVAGIVATLGGVDPSAFAIENLPTWLDAGASAEVDLSYRRATDRLGAQHQLPDRLPLANLASQVR